MKSSRLFLRGFCGTLLVILPLFLVLAAFGFSGATAAAAPRRDVPVYQALQSDAENILLITGDDCAAPSLYVLIRLDAWQNRICVTAFTPNTAVTASGRSSTLADAAAQAGPAQAAAALSETLGVPIDRYAFVPRDILLRSAERLGTAKIRLCDYASDSVLQQLQLKISGTDTAVLPPWQLSDILRSGKLTSPARPQIAALGTASLLQSGLAALPAVLDDVFRTNYQALTTNITAEDIYDYEHIARLLIKFEPEFWASALPMRSGSANMILEDTAAETAQQYFSRPAPDGTASDGAQAAANSAANDSDQAAANSAASDSAQTAASSAASDNTQTAANSAASGSVQAAAIRAETQE